ncbi:MAG: Spermidine synthase [Elusimicrobia bacterium ADurb.Bin231]|nr:MAG: Spermidine synthase [Elusimicrobia bacterium ADurb.Bin231]
MNFLLLFLLGFVSLSYQVIFLREILSIFNDNEITVGIFLCVWMFCAGIGAYFTGRAFRLKQSRRNNIPHILLISAVLMPAQIFLVRFAAPIMRKTTAEMLGIVPLLFVSFVCMAAVCFIFGSWFVIVSDTFSVKGNFRGLAAVSYSAESAGAVLGGFVASIIFLKYFNSITLSLLLSCAVLCIACIFFSKKYLFVLAAALAVLAGSCRIENFLSARLWKPFEIEESRNSIYGKITVLKSGSDFDFFVNSSRVYSTYANPVSEEIIHLPMLLSDSPAHILYIGGASGLSEILKYNVKNIVYIAPDRVFFRLVKKYSSRQIHTVLNDPRISIIHADGRFFVKNTDQRFDCAILELPRPLTGVANRYFTLEFFRELKSALSENGILIFSMFASENYMSPELKFLSSSVSNAAKNVFANCYYIPGETDYFVCSERELKFDPGYLKSALAGRGARTLYLTPYRMEYMLDGSRIRRLSGWIAENEKNIFQNRDFYPVCYFYGLVHWLSHFKSGSVFNMPIKKIYYRVFFIIFCLYAFFIARICRSNKRLISGVMFWLSFAGLALELMVIFAFQSIYGYIYYKVGMLFALALFGVSAGSYLIKRLNYAIVSERKFLRKVILLMSLFAFLLPFCFKLLACIQYPCEPVFYGLIFVSGAFIGIGFPVLVSAYGETGASTLGRFYFLDLAGAFSGSFLTTLILMPVLGIFGTCLFIACASMILGLVF